MSGKQCDKCRGHFKGFGTTCSTCRKVGAPGGQARSCGKCGNFFSGFGTECQECQRGRGHGRTGVRVPTPEEVDQCLAKIDTCIQQVDASQQSMVRLRKAEFDLLVQLEIARDLVQRILSSGDRLLLRSTFVDCGRIARLNASLDSIRLSDMNATDQRYKNCKAMLASLTDLIVNDLGMQQQLSQKIEVARKASLTTRVSFLMDKEKVTEARAAIDPAATRAVPAAGNYWSAYSGDAGCGDDARWEEAEDCSDWEGEDHEEMTADEAEALLQSNARVLFDELDTNKDGLLSREEVLNGAAGLSSLLKACRIHKRKHVVKMFKEGDIESSGALAFGSFVNYILDARQKSFIAHPKQIDDDKVKRIFDIMDKDHDGAITRAELELAYAGVLLEAGEAVDSKRVSSWAGRNLDKYGKDGSSALDLNEFKGLLSHSGALAPMLDFAFEVEI